EALAALLGRLMGVEYRQAPRLPVLLSVSHGEVTTQSLGRSKDLSLTGIRVRTAARFRKGFNLNLHLPLDNERPIVTPGLVTRSPTPEGGEYAWGLRFVSLRGEARDRLAVFLPRRQS